MDLRHLGRLATVPGVVSAQNYEADGKTAEVSCPSVVFTRFTYSPHFAKRPPPLDAIRRRG